MARGENLQARPQKETSGMKWRAIAAQIVGAAEKYAGQGSVAYLDDTLGQYGIINSPKGHIWYGYGPYFFSEKPSVYAGQCFFSFSHV